MPPSMQTNRLISTLRLLIPRLRLLQKKDTASSVAQRRELAQLLDSGRDASARIRVENVIATDIAVEVMEMIELYCELLLARAAVLDTIAFGEKGARARSRAKGEEGRRGGKDAKSGGSESASGNRGFGLFGGGGGNKAKEESQERAREDEHLDEEGEDEGYIDPGLDEAAAAIFYAWPRFPREVRELTTLRNQLVERWGKDFASLAQDNKAGIKVPERLLKSLRVRPPPKELVESYLREIAKAYGVSWPKGEARESLGTPPPPEFVDDRDDHNGSSGDVPEAPSTPQKPDLSEMRRASEAELSKATPPRDIGPHSPVSVAPPGPTTDNLNPKVKFPGSEADSQPRKLTPEPKKTGNGIPEMDELARRFAALKK
ncbi:Vacuolar protein sorting-associated protein ist1 [Paecilomyces lecythidis]|uniref:Vacuolar protein sorting-associated protein ist1 n=1 Tax=Paecilomyces lecythidis TaxID=3004212 RepID=A0ABR3X4P7_9EURO